MRKSLMRRLCPLCHQLQSTLNKFQALRIISWTLQALLLYFAILKDWLIAMDIFGIGPTLKIVTHPLIKIYSYVEAGGNHSICLYVTFGCSVVVALIMGFSMLSANIGEGEILFVRRKGSGWISLVTLLILLT